MSSKDDVLLVSHDPHTLDEVRAALAASDRFELTGVCKDLAEAEGHLGRHPASAVLVDIDLEAGRSLLGIASLVPRFPDTRFVVLAGAVRSELLVEAMQAGARHCLAKASVGAELASALGRLVPQGYAGVLGRGHVITVLSASGGCGATTVAVNLANELGLETSQPALVVDLDVSYGTVAHYLGVKGEYGIADVLAYDGHIDAHLIQTCTAEFSATLRVLLSPCSISFSQPRPLRLEALAESLEACKTAFRHTVVDAPRVAMDVAAALAKASTLTFLVFQLTVKDIRLVCACASALLERGVARDQILPLANRYYRRSPIGLREAREALGEGEIELVRSDYGSAVRSLNYGQPLAQAAPRSAPRKDIRRLAMDRVLRHEAAPLIRR